MLDSLLPYLGWVALLSFALSACGVLLSVVYFQRARRDRYFVLRKEAQARGMWWLSASTAFLVLAVVALVVRTRNPASGTPVATATLVPIPTSAMTTEIAPTATPIQVATSVPATPAPTATAPFIPTPTPGFPLPEGASAFLPEAVPAAPGAGVTLSSFAQEIQNSRPVNPGTEFSAGDYRVYLFLNYVEMGQGVTWTYAWYQDGRYLDGNTCRWAVVDEECPRTFAGSGFTFIFYRLPGGYVPGTYRVSIWIEGRLQGEASFTVNPAPE